MSSTIRAILFDAVGTLIYPDPPVAEVYHRLGRQFGSALTEEEIKNRFAEAFTNQEKADFPASNSFRRQPTDHTRERQRWQQIVAAVFRDVRDPGGSLFETLWHHFAQPQHWRLYPDVAAAWHRLSQHDGLLLGIASNFDRRIINICRELTPLVDQQRLFYSANIGFSKPDPRFFHFIQRELDVPAENILLVGDNRVNDFEGARAGDWQAVLLDRAVNPEGADAEVARTLSDCYLLHQGES